MTLMLKTHSIITLTLLKSENSEYVKFNYYTTDEFGKLCNGITDNLELSIFHSFAVLID